MTFASRAAYPPSRSGIGQFPLSPAVLLDHALPPEQAAGLLQYAIANEQSFTPAVTLAHDLTLQEGRFRRARTLGDLGPYRGLADRILRRHRAAIGARFGLLDAPPDQLEEEIAASGDGAFFARHQDSGLAPVAHRSFTLILYLHCQPRRFSGGELLLYGTQPMPDGIMRSVPVDAIEPRHNRCVLFPAGTFHEILPVSAATDDFAGSRFAVTSWF